MDVFYSDTFELPLPSGHRFPMSKYRLLRERVAAAKLPGVALRIPHAATDRELARVHCPEYIRRVAEGGLSDLEVRRIGFPWSPQMVVRSRRSTGASIDAARSALRDGVAVNLAGGTHHAFPDSGQGYCVFNDTAVAARAMQAEGCARRVLFVDLDVHQGNGTAAIAGGDDSLFTFSMHCEKNFPFRKANSDLDVSLPAGAADDVCLQKLEESLAAIERRFRADLVFYLAGADPYEGDRLGHLAMTRQGLEIRDALVLDFCRRHSIACAISMAGGYAPHVDDVVDIHFATVRTAARFGRGESVAPPAGSLPAAG